MNLDTYQKNKKYYQKNKHLTVNELTYKTLKEYCDKNNLKVKNYLEYIILNFIKLLNENDLNITLIDKWNIEYTINGNRNTFQSEEYLINVIRDLSNEKIELQNEIDELENEIERLNNEIN